MTNQEKIVEYMAGKPLTELGLAKAFKEFPDPQDWLEPYPGNDVSLIELMIQRMLPDLYANLFIKQREEKIKNRNAGNSAAYQNESVKKMRITECRGMVYNKLGKISVADIFINTFHRSMKHEDLIKVIRTEIEAREIGHFVQVNDQIISRASRIIENEETKKIIFLEFLHRISTHVTFDSWHEYVGPWLDYNIKLAGSLVREATDYAQSNMEYVTEKVTEKEDRTPNYLLMPREQMEKSDSKMLLTIKILSGKIQSSTGLMLYLFEHGLMDRKAFRVMNNLTTTRDTKSRFFAPFSSFGMLTAIQNKTAYIESLINESGGKENFLLEMAQDIGLHVNMVKGEKNQSGAPAEGMDLKEIRQLITDCNPELQSISIKDKSLIDRLMDSVESIYDQNIERTNLKKIIMRNNGDSPNAAKPKKQVI